MFSKIVCAISGNFLPRGLDGRLRWSAWLDLAWTDAREMASHLSLKLITAFAQWPNLTSWRTRPAIHGLMGTMHVHLPQGLDGVSHLTKSPGGSPWRFRRWGMSSNYYFFPWHSGRTVSQVRLCEPGCKGNRKTQKAWMYRLPKSKLTSMNTSKLDLI